MATAACHLVRSGLAIAVSRHCLRLGELIKPLAVTAIAMNLRKTTDGWLVEAPAKLNLYLEVLGRRADGFHEVETLVTPISLHDTLDFRAVDEADQSITLTVQDARTRANGTGFYGELPPSDDRNLVIQALRLLRDAIGTHAGLAVTLTKRIPSEAGLGGGSSDAAAALVAGHRMWGGGLSFNELSELAAQIGSDVPLFLRRGASVCTGRGEQITPAEIPAGLPIVLIQPPVGLGAGQVYGELCSSGQSSCEMGSCEVGSQMKGTRTGRCDDLVEALRTGRRDLQQATFFNRLQQPAAQLTNWIERLKGLFNKLSLVAHQMTGSGSVYFGIAKSWRTAQQAAASLRRENIGWVGTARTIA